MNDVLVGAVAAAVGVVVVGPLMVDAVLRWIGWRVALPLLLGRVPARSELADARGRCRRCGATLAPAGAPAVPFLVAGGRCRACREPLAGWYGLVETACGAVLGVACAVVGWSTALVPVIVLVVGLLAVSITDLAVMRIPTRFVLLTFAGLVAGMALVALTDGPVDRLAGGAIGALVFGGFLLALHLISPRSLGFGDVRLGTLVGAAAGWSAWRAEHPVLAPIQAVTSSLLLAGLIGATVGLVLLAARRRDLPFPFGPALALGGLVVCLSAIGSP